MQYVKKKYNILIFAFLLLIILPISINFINTFKLKSIQGIVVHIDNNSFTIITENNSIYSFKYNKHNLKIDDEIHITYSKNISNLKSIQNVFILKIIKKSVNYNDYDKDVISIIKKMNLGEKIGQLLLARTPEYNQLDTISNYKLCGYILFSRDVNNITKEELIKKINSYQEISKIPLFIAIDEEGGTVSRLNNNENIVKSPFLSSQNLYKQNGFNSIKEDAVRKEKLLNELGINMNLAPVADISQNENSYIYERTFGKGAKETSLYIKTIMSTQTDNVTYVLKHFPGYGDNLDTHSFISIDNRKYEFLAKNDFIPFKTGIENNAKVIMVSHNIVSKIDKKPASLSKNIHNILRNNLKFNGVILTDDLSMNGLKYNENSIYIDALLAGNNILIVTDYNTAFDSIYKSITSGNISEKLIDKLIYNTLKLKKEKGLI